MKVSTLVILAAGAYMYLKSKNPKAAAQVAAKSSEASKMIASIASDVISAYRPMMSDFSMQQLVAAQPFTVADKQNSDYNILNAANAPAYSSSGGVVPMQQIVNSQPFTSSDTPAANPIAPAMN